MKRSEMVSYSHIFRFPAKPGRKMAINQYNNCFCSYYTTPILRTEARKN